MRTIQNFLCGLALMIAPMVIAPIANAADVNPTTFVWPNGIGIGFGGADSTAFAGKGATQAAMASSARVTNTAWFATSARPGGVPRVTFLEATTDRAGDTGVEFWVSTNSVTATNAQLANTNLVIVSSTNGLVVGDTILVQHGVTSGTTDAYQYLVISNFTGFTVHFYQSMSNAIAVGDRLFEMTQSGKLNYTVGNGNVGADGYTNFVVKSKQFYAPGSSALFSGIEGRPLLVTVVASNAVAEITTINGEYWKRPRP